MKTVDFFKRIATSRKRARLKEAVLNEVASTEQQNKNVVNLHRIDFNNAGDYFCAPHHYFDELNLKSDIFDYKLLDKKITNKWINTISNNSLILGGGGLLNRSSFEKPMKTFESLTSKNKKIVLWGIGHNSKKRKDFNKVKNYNIDLTKFPLAGTRDYGFSENWVPCVSCLHPLFEKEFETLQETGIIFHKKTLKNKSLTGKFKDYPTTSNTTNIKNLIDFIGKSETIITDSYHAMYWSMLLEKKVVVVPNSSKFFDFKYKPEFSSFENCLEDAKRAPKYTGILEECKEINYNFAEKVFDYLEI